MEARDMIPGSADWRRLKALNRRAFPEDERRSIPVLALAARLREPVELKGWYEADCFTGFTVTVALGHCLYLAFIAVEGCPEPWPWQRHPAGTSGGASGGLSAGGD